MLTEERVASKVAELMETLDHIKKYNAIAKSLKKFILIVGSSIAAFLAIVTVFEICELELVLNHTMFFVVAFLSLLIPLAGLACGVLYMRKQINAVKDGEWRPEIAKGFSSTLKLLVDMDWEKTLEDISIGRLGYMVYGLFKAGTYLVVTVAAFELAWNGFTLIFLHQLVWVGALFWGLIAVLVVAFALGNDLLKRYRELRALDMLVWELRWFSVEFGRAEFQA
jgi:predicted neutral ceramidase superfamily lipid hydrolase